MLSTIKQHRKSLAETYMEMDEIDIGRMASGGHGVDKRKQFVSDVRELARLARKAEIAISSGGRL